MSKKLVTLDSMREYNQKEVAELRAEVAEVKEAAVQPDWNQNDAAAADFVKNRPFYSTFEEGEEILSDTNSITSGIGTNMIEATIDGTKYSTTDIFNLTINGETCYNIPFRLEDGGQYGYGNLGLLGPVAENTGEDYVLVFEPVKNQIWLMVAEGSIIEDFTLTRIGQVETIKKLDKKFLPFDAITNYVTTDSDQTDLTGKKTYTSGLVFDPNNSLGYSKFYSSIESTTEFNWINNSLKFTSLKPGLTTLPSDAGDTLQKETYYNKDGFKIAKVFHNIMDGVEATAEDLHVFHYEAGLALPYHTYYRYNSIVHSEADKQNSGSLPEITLTFPTESGVLATEEWVNNNLDFGNELILGKGTITDDGDEYTTGIYTNTEITLADYNISGVVSTTTVYGRDNISYNHFNGTGENETFGESKSCTLSFPDGDGTIATQEYISNKIEENNENLLALGIPQQAGWKVINYKLNYNFKTYNDVDFYHEGFADFIEYESIADSTKHIIKAYIHITSEETISEPSDIGIKVLTTAQVGNKWESKALYVNNVFPESFLDNTKYTNITVDKYQWITDITLDAVGRFNSNGSVGPVLYADRSNGFVPLVWGNGLELDTYNDGQSLIIGGKEIEVTYYDYHSVVDNKKL